MVGIFNGNQREHLMLNYYNYYFFKLSYVPIYIVLSKLPLNNLAA